MKGSALHSGLPARDNSCRAGSHVSIQRICDFVGDPRACTAFRAGSRGRCEDGDVVRWVGIGIDGWTHQWIFLLDRHTLGIHNNDLWTGDILEALGCWMSRTFPCNILLAASHAPTLFLVGLDRSKRGRDNQTPSPPPSPSSPNDPSPFSPFPSSPSISHSG
jgi:hypothetical protein